MYCDNHNHSQHLSWWCIILISTDAFKKMPWKLAKASEIPLYGRGHPTPNRYNDILPTAATRVQLKVLGSDKSTEYINANWVRGT